MSFIFSGISIFPTKYWIIPAIIDHIIKGINVLEIRRLKKVFVSYLFLYSMSVAPVSIKKIGTAQKNKTSIISAASQSDDGVNLCTHLL